MRCIAQDIQDDIEVQVKIHGGKLKSKYNYRSTAKKPVTKKIDKETEKNLDSHSDRMMARMMRDGRQ